MKRNYIEKEIKRISRNALITLILGAVVAAFLLLTSTTSLTNIFGKNVNIRNYQDLHENYNKGNVYAKEENIKISDTGLYSTSNKSRNRYYYVITIEDEDTYKYIFYKSSKHYTASELKKITVKGKISIMVDIDQKIHARAISSMATSLNTDTNVTSKYIASDIIIDGTASKLGEQIYKGFLILLFFTLLVFIARQIIFLMDYKKHKIYKRLEKEFGKEPEAIGSKIDSELERDALIINKKYFKITDTYIIVTSVLTCNIRLKKDLIWGYYNEIKHYTNGIPSGKSYNIYLYLNRNAKDLLTVASGNKKKTIHTINLLAEKIDTALFGYDEELKALHTKDFPAFVKFVEDVAEKRKKENKVKEKENQ